MAEACDQELSRLDVKPAAPMTGYSRGKFGAAWQDVDHNGCDTRDDILKRDLKPFTFRTGDDCEIAKGTEVGGRREHTDDQEGIDGEARVLRGELVPLEPPESLQDWAELLVAGAREDGAR